MSSDSVVGKVLLVQWLSVIRPCYTHDFSSSVNYPVGTLSTESWSEGRARLGVFRATIQRISDIMTIGL